MKLFVPSDSAALALGANELTAAIAAEADRRHIDITLVRNGSRGMLWLEPMLEVSTPEGRIAYGPVETTDVVSLFDADFLHGWPATSSKAA